MIQKGKPKKYILLMICFLLPQCGPHSSKQPFIIKHTNRYVFEETRQNVKIKVHRLSQVETKKIFNGRGAYFLCPNNPIYPLSLTIENHSDSKIILDTLNISLDLLHWPKVAKQLHLCPKRRILTSLAIGLATTGVGLLGAAYITLVGVALSAPLAIQAGYASLAMSGTLLLSTPAIAYFQSQKCALFNEHISHEVKEKICTSIQIEPKQNASCLIFACGKKFRSNFTIKLITQTVDCEDEIKVNVTL